MSAYVRNPQTIPDDSVGGSSVRQGVAEQNNVAINDLYSVVNAHANNEMGRSHVQIDDVLDTLTDTESAKVAAEAARDKAQEWAENPEGVEVEAGAYSAKHHAIKAAASATEAESFLVELPLDISQGGTGGESAEEALEALGAEPADADILKADTAATLTAGFSETIPSYTGGSIDLHNGNLQTMDTTSYTTIGLPTRVGRVLLLLKGGGTVGYDAGYDKVVGEYDSSKAGCLVQVVNDGTDQWIVFANTEA